MRFAAHGVDPEGEDFSSKAATIMIDQIQDKTLRSSKGKGEHAGAEPSQEAAMSGGGGGARKEVVGLTEANLRQMEEVTQITNPKNHLHHFPCSLSTYLPANAPQPAQIDEEKSKCISDPRSNKSTGRTPLEQQQNKSRGQSSRDLTQLNTITEGFQISQNMHSGVGYQNAIRVQDGIWEAQNGKQMPMSPLAGVHAPHHTDQIQLLSPHSRTLTTIDHNPDNFEHRVEHQNINNSFIGPERPKIPVAHTGLSLGSQIFSFVANTNEDQKRQFRRKNMKQLTVEQQVGVLNNGEGSYRGGKDWIVNGGVRALGTGKGVATLGEHGELPNKSSEYVSPKGALNTLQTHHHLHQFSQPDHMLTSGTTAPTSLAALKSMVHSSTQRSRPAPGALGGALSGSGPVRAHSLSRNGNLETSQAGPVPRDTHEYHQMLLKQAQQQKQSWKNIFPTGQMQSITQVQPQQQHSKVLSDIRRRNLSMMNTSGMLIEQSDRSSYSRGSKNSLNLPSPFEASQLLKLKIGGLARRNLALQKRQNDQLEHQLIQNIQQNGSSHYGQTNNSLQYLNPLTANQLQYSQQHPGTQNQHQHNLDLNPNIHLPNSSASPFASRDQHFAARGGVFGGRNTSMGAVAVENEVGFSAQTQNHLPAPLNLLSRHPDDTHDSYLFQKRQHAAADSLNVSNNVASHTIQVTVKGQTGELDRALSPKSEGPFKDQAVQGSISRSHSLHSVQSDLNKPQPAELSEGGGGFGIQTSSKTLPKISIDQQSVMSRRNDDESANPQGSRKGGLSSSIQHGHGTLSSNRGKNTYFKAKRHSQLPPGRPPLPGKVNAAQQINAVGDLDTSLNGEITHQFNWLKNHREVALDPKEREQGTDPRTRDIAIGVQDKKYFARGSVLSTVKSDRQSSQSRQQVAGADGHHASSNASLANQNGKHVHLPSIDNKTDKIENQDQDQEDKKKPRKHHKSKDKCAICIEKRAKRQRLREAREAAKQKGESRDAKRGEEYEVEVEKQNNSSDNKQIEIDKVDDSQPIDQIEATENKGQEEITPTKSSDVAATNNDLKAEQKTLLVSQTQNNSIEQINIIDQAASSIEKKKETYSNFNMDHQNKDQSNQQLQSKKPIQHHAVKPLSVALASSQNVAQPKDSQRGQPGQLDEQSITFNQQSNQHLHAPGVYGDGSPIYNQNTQSFHQQPGVQHNPTAAVAPSSIIPGQQQPPMVSFNQHFGTQSGQSIQNFNDGGGLLYDSFNFNQASKGQVNSLKKEKTFKGMTESSSLQRQFQQQQQPLNPSHPKPIPSLLFDSSLPLISLNGQATYNPMDSALNLAKQPIYKYYARGREEQLGNNPGDRHTSSKDGGVLLKQFKQQDMEMYYSERQLRPEIEEEIKSGFFEITKKFNESIQGSSVPANGDNGTSASNQNDTQVYVSHLCLHNYHPIFSKFALDTVKIILHYSSIVYLSRGQTLFAEKFNSQYIYIVLFGRLRLFRPQTIQSTQGVPKAIHNNQQTNTTTEQVMQAYGQTLNLGWTIGEEILFKPDHPSTPSGHRKDTCKAMSEAGVLGIQKENLHLIKNALFDRGDPDEFSKLEIILRGNYLVKTSKF